MARKTRHDTTNNKPSSSPPSKEEETTATFRLYQGTLLAGYEDKIRNELMDLVHQIETETKTCATASQREDLGNVVASYAEAHANGDGDDDGGDEEARRPLLEEEKMADVLLSIRNKFRDTVDGQAGESGTAYAKLINWYSRELDKLAREKMKGKKEQKKRT
ncbi:hypothetical protein L249_4292 [Ophiocordyceps polyrhachis-furcata BCC 54312]|uniref:Uncharacterized protein n=1 Tax=Ophiocordyceps polyrhachis-furcata BCC 54312 TaxID=1330021 RepID=A0A367L7G5_9HYPO|nr:hypothetical protein L249_4292 [Ophiocordyceps polyrhachis-furcata BCC 54312]